MPYLKKKKIHIFHLILLNYAFLFFSKLGSEFQTKFQIGVVSFLGHLDHMDPTT